MKHEYPTTRRGAVVDEVHGIRIEDPYRWLEDSSSQEVRDWAEKQNMLAVSVLEKYSGYEILRKQIRSLYSYDYVMVDDFKVVKLAGDVRFFYLFRGAGRNLPSLCYQDGEQGGRVVLFDPDSVSGRGPVSVDWFMPSNDGSLIAFGLSEGGTEKSVLHVMRVQTKETLAEKIAQTRWCRLAWLHNDGFYYSRYPLPGTVPREEESYYHHVFYHRLGNDYRDDTKVFGEGRAKTEHPFLWTNDDCSLLAVMSYRFTSSDVHVSRINRSNPGDLIFSPVVESDSCESFAAFAENELYVMTQIGAPNGQILRYDLSKLQTDETVPQSEPIVREGEGVIFGNQYARFAVFDGHIAVIEDMTASSSLKVYEIETGNLVEDVRLGNHATLYQLVTAPGLDTFYYSLVGFFSPVAHYRYQRGQPRTLFRPKLAFDTDDYKSQLVWYTSKDGTKVSMFLLSKKSTRFSQETPVTITGYGGFGISMTPEYYPELVAWIENGGVVAVPHLRGGGEYGQKWHTAGCRENKQNAFDDFISAIEWLLGEGIGSPRTMASYGGSNGGLLVGAALVQRPDLFAAVSCHVPLLDMVRYTNFQVAQTWMSEYGNPSVREEFEWLRSYSPYHNLKDAQYPATLLCTALGDTRVDSMHAFKMAARLQSLAGPLREANPILLYTLTHAGHGGSSLEKSIDLTTKSTIFRAHHTGLRIGKNTL